MRNLPWEEANQKVFSVIRKCTSPRPLLVSCGAEKRIPEREKPHCSAPAVRSSYSFRLVIHVCHPHSVVDRRPDGGGERHLRQPRPRPQRAARPRAAARALRPVSAGAAPRLRAAPHRPRAASSPAPSPAARRGDGAVVPRLRHALRVRVRGHAAAAPVAHRRHGVALHGLPLHGLQAVRRAHGPVLGREEVVVGGAAALRDEGPDVPGDAELHGGLVVARLQGAGHALAGRREGPSAAQRAGLRGELHLRVPDGRDGSLPHAAGGRHHGHVRRPRHTYVPSLLLLLLCCCYCC